MKLRPRRVLSLIVALACLAYFARQIWRSWPEISAIERRPSVLAAFLAACVIQAACSMVNA